MFHEALVAEFVTLERAVHARTPTFRFGDQRVKTLVAILLTLLDSLHRHDVIALALLFFSNATLVFRDRLLGPIRREVEASALIGARSARGVLATFGDRVGPVNGVRAERAVIRPVSVRLLDAAHASEAVSNATHAETRVCFRSEVAHG